MVFWIIGGYVLFGALTICLVAYDAFSQQFDWGLSGGWEFWWWQRYVLWAIVLVLSPLFFVKEVVDKIKERKYVNQWRTTGSFTRKL